MTYCVLSPEATLKRICLAMIANKPKMVDGKATYLGKTYNSLDDAWDWFEDDMNFVKWNIAEQYLDPAEHRQLRKELEAAE